MSRAVRGAPTVDPAVSAARDGHVLNRDPAQRRSPRWTGPVVMLGGVIAVAAAIVARRGSGPATHASHVGLMTGVFAIVSMTAFVTYLVILAVLHALPTGYSAVRNAVSDYGVGPYRWLFSAGLYVSSLGVLTLGVALLVRVGTPPLATHDLVYLALIPLARMGMTVFATTLEGHRVTRTGLLHYACAIAAFTLTYLVISDMTPTLRALHSGAWARAPLGWTAWVVAPALALVVITMFKPLRRVFGLFERIFLLATNVWFALAATLLITGLH